MENLVQEIEDFVEKRNWTQYHSPKNLAMALTVETAELLEIFQWLTPDESVKVTKEQREHIEEEIGDVMIYLTTLAKGYGINPIEAAKKKILKNALKYPLP
jgi:dCTP diphosphatase